MKKTLLSIVLMLAGCLCASAQFEQGKKYIGASLSNIDLSYNKARDFNFGMNLNGGYFLDDEFLVKADLGYAYESKTHAFNAAAGARYYFVATASLSVLVENCNGATIMVKRTTARPYYTPLLNWAMPFSSTAT